MLSSCSSFLYHDAIEQGQMPQASVVKKIHVGMNEKAVVQLLGEPTWLTLYTPISGPMFIRTPKHGQMNQRLKNSNLSLRMAH